MIQWDHNTPPLTRRGLTLVMIPIRDDRQIGDRPTMSNSRIRFIYDYHPDMMAPPIATKDTTNPWIFVFGSNLAGVHGAGAAKRAFQDFGARYGVGYGLERQSFGIPTKDKEIQSMSLVQIHQYINIARRQITHRLENTHERYWFTRIGCGLAGYTDKDIAPMFAGFAAHLSTPPERLTTRVSFPIEWRPFLEPELHNDAILEETLFKEATHTDDLVMLQEADIMQAKSQIQPET